MDIEEAKRLYEKALQEEHAVEQTLREARLRSSEARSILNNLRHEAKMAAPLTKQQRDILLLGREPDGFKETWPNKTTYLERKDDYAHLRSLGFLWAHRTGWLKTTIIGEKKLAQETK